MSPSNAAPADGTLNLETEVLVIGGGVTGSGVMRDLALRGIRCLLIDRRDLCAGASGGNHGLLHSGGRYVSTDPGAAVECARENALLKRLVPQCIEDTGGLFVAVEGDDAEFATRFPALCAAAGVPCESVTTAEARRLEPRLSQRLIQAYRVPDAAIDPFHLAMENVDHARQANGSEYRAHAEVRRFEIADGEIRAAVCVDPRNGAEIVIRARQYINAGGAWAMDIARLAGCRDVELRYAKGTILVHHERLAHHVVNRLRPPGDGDILVPGGTVSLLGTTSSRCDDLEHVVPTADEIDRNIGEGAAMVPTLAGGRYTRAFSRVRPLLVSAGTSDRAASRGFALFDHQTQGLANFCTITGGKLTTFRLMAEKTVDLVARRLGVDRPCATAEQPLPRGAEGRWTEAGAAPRHWYRNADADDMILCECEMVPRSAIDEIVAAAPDGAASVSLEAIALRSRVGKGPCQGAFCGIRVSSYLYDRGRYADATGLVKLREFLDERFKGQRTVIWGQQAAQIELAEAVHCGLMGLDALEDS